MPEIYSDTKAPVLEKVRYIKNPKQNHNRTLNPEKA